MALNRDKFRKIVGGITTVEPEPIQAPEAATPESAIAKPEKEPPAGQGRESCPRKRHRRGRGGEDRRAPSVCDAGPTQGPEGGHHGRQNPQGQGVAVSQRSRS